MSALVLCENTFSKKDHRPSSLFSHHALLSSSYVSLVDYGLPRGCTNVQTERSHIVFASLQPDLYR